jgi:2,5-furandicarboxylate decarboxylase 1
MDLKHVVVVDDDIDVFDPTEVEWAIATRVQADRDVMIVTHARGKPLDPSLAPTPPGGVPTTAKVGIDATIGEGIPRERYERISYAYADRARIADYLAGKTDPAQPPGAQAAAELARRYSDS